MLKRHQLPAALLVGAALWLAAGCTPPPPPANPPSPPITKVTPTAPPASAGPAAQDTTDTTAVAEGIAQAMKQHASLFPKGTKLESVTVHDGVAALDFSPEFNKLSNMGDTTESHAQKQLRAALAKFPSIQKMTVTVHGKPFDSQATDWTTPFPVRLTEDEKDAAANPDASGADTASSKGGGR